MMFLIPTWQTPDEYTHLSLIGKAIKNNEFADIVAKNIKLDINRIIGNYDEKVNVQELLQAMGSQSTYVRDDLLPKGIELSVVKHLPATIGLLLGIVLKLPMYWVLQIGELFSLLFYVFVCYFALKLMPIKREMFAMLMMLPMALQQAGGIGYDSVLIPLCFLFIAYVFNLKFKEKIQLKHFIFLFVIGMIISYIKLPSCFLFMLFLILPLDRICFKIGKLEITGSLIKKCLIPILMIGLLLLGMGIYVFRENFYVNIIIGLFAEWKRTLFLLKETGVFFHERLITGSVGNFGWLDTPILYEIAILVYFIIFVISLFNSDKKETSKLRKRDKIVIWATFIVLCVFTTFGMVNHTIMIILYGSEWVEETYNIHEALYQIPYIGGVQGRYYLPFVGLLFLPLPQIKEVGKNRMWAIFVILELIMFAYIGYILMARYWIV